METFATGIGGPVDLRSGPGGDLFYIDIYNGQVVCIYAGLPSAPPPEAPRPTAAIDRPTPDTKPYLGRQLGFSGSATDEAGQALPPSALRWTLVVLHCADEEHCHRHFIETREGVASGSFTVPPRGAVQAGGRPASHWHHRLRPDLRG